MHRSLVTIAIAFLLAAVISRAEQSRGVTHRSPEWVRTIDGWEDRSVVDARPTVAPRLVHPGLIAALEAGISILGLMAFPTRTQALTPAPVPRTGPRLRRPRIAKKSLAASR